MHRKTLHIYIFQLTFLTISGKFKNISIPAIETHNAKIRKRKQKSTTIDFRVMFGSAPHLFEIK